MIQSQMQMQMLSAHVPLLFETIIEVHVMYGFHYCPGLHMENPLN